jgi:hypothetical protein
MSNHIDPSRISISGMVLSSGGDVSIAPDARFSVQASDFYRHDESDHQFVGAAIGGLDESEFKKKKPILLFKISNESVARKAYSIAELLAIPGFPDNVSWVSNAAGTPEFDRFFEVTEDGVSVKKRVVVEDQVEANTCEYNESIKKDPSGIVGVVKNGVVSADRVANVSEGFDAPEDSQSWRFLGNGVVYWFADAGEESNSLVSKHLSNHGWVVERHAIITFTETPDTETPDTLSMSGAKQKKKKA